MKQQEWAWSSTIAYGEREVYTCKCMNETKPIKLWVVGTIHVKHVVVRLGHYDGTNMMS